MKDQDVDTFEVVDEAFEVVDEVFDTDWILEGIVANDQVEDFADIGHVDDLVEVFLAVADPVLGSRISFLNLGHDGLQDSSNRLKHPGGFPNPSWSQVWICILPICQ